MRASGRSEAAKGREGETCFLHAGAMAGNIFSCSVSLCILRPLFNVMRSCVSCRQLNKHPQLALEDQSGSHHHIPAKSASKAPAYHGLQIECSSECFDHKKSNCGMEAYHESILAVQASGLPLSQRYQNHAQNYLKSEPASFEKMDWRTANQSPAT